MKITGARTHGAPLFYKTLDFFARAGYNGSMKLEKIAAEVFPSPAADFGEPRHVQGAEVQTADNFIRIVTAGRFKRFPAGKELLRVVRGSGSIKWARGETPFSEGDAFCADGLEEYELGGGGEFLVCKQQ